MAYESQMKYYLKHREELLEKMRVRAKKYYHEHREEIIQKVKSKYVPTGRPRGRPKKIIKEDNAS
jgi:hypothetical protein